MRIIETGPGRRLFRAAAHLRFLAWWSRAMTLGVRVAAFDDDAIFLVRHTYTPGWHLPGGAVDKGETAEAAAVRELREEGGLRCLERPKLHHFFRNIGRDHVACYVVRAFERDPWTPDWEIADARFFSLSDLPPETTRGTRDRIAEIVEGRPPGEHW